MFNHNNFDSLTTLGTRFSNGKLYRFWKRTEPAVLVTSVAKQHVISWSCHFDVTLIGLLMRGSNFSVSSSVLFAPCERPPQYSYSWTGTFWKTSWREFSHPDWLGRRGIQRGIAGLFAILYWMITKWYTSCVTNLKLKVWQPGSSNEVFWF